MKKKYTVQEIAGVVFLGVFLLVVVGLAGFGNIRAAQENASYANGDYYFDFNSGVYEVGVSNEGIITCGAKSGNFARCGEGKYLGYNEVLELTPLLTVVSVLVVFSTLSFQRLNSGKQVPIMRVLVQFVASAVLSALVILFLNVFDGLMVEFVKYTGAIGKLIPTIAVLVGVLLPAFVVPQFVDTRGNKRRTAWRGY